MAATKSLNQTSTALVQRPDATNTPSSDDKKCLVHFLDSKDERKDSSNSNGILRNRDAKHDSVGDVDFLPSDLLLSLAKPAERFENLGPNGKDKIKRNTKPSKNIPKKPPDNAWNHPQSREKLKHLVDQTPCICGAGRDISFLYDTVSSKRGSKQTDSDTNEYASMTDGSPTRGKRGTPGTGTKDPKAVFDTLVPSEFHIVKNPGVLGLEYHDDKYATKTEDHQHHLTLFPSLKPAGRQEALQLKHTMTAMLKRAGVEDDESEEMINENSDAPTQIHELLEIVKQEQTIYNVVFSELIRQVTVECVERGELLADLRKRYAKLLDKVPRRVKSLHEEVLAQRALDRRLTEELTRFKSSITVLTKELNEVQAHDKEVTKQAKETQEQLKSALKESEKNASLLSEYHELYELQRKRLEHQISSLIQERDLWAGGSYILALKVAQKHSLTTSKRLHLHEKAWHKLGSHFSMLLNNQDSIQLQTLNGHLQSWQDVTLKFNKKLCDAENETYQKFKVIQRQLTAWGQDFLRVVTPDESSVHVPDKQLILRLCEDMKAWEEVFNTEAERFTGDALLSCEDDLLTMNRLVDRWTDAALQIFSRHPQKSGGMSVQHERMLSMNKQVESLHHQFKLRMTGENGLAKGLIHLINVYGTWVNKLNSLAKGGESMLDPEWVRLADFIQNEWPSNIMELIFLVAPDDAEEDINLSKMSLLSVHEKQDRVSMQELRESVQKWIKDTTIWIENEDGGLVDKVTSCHSDMVKWMVTVLHRLAPDFDQNEHDIEEDSADEGIGIGAAILVECTSEQISQKATLLFRLIKSLTKTIYDCAIDIVLTKMQERKDAGDETAEFEYKDLKKDED